MSDDSRKEWVRYNPLTHAYETPDGTRVAAELVDDATGMVDLFYIATIRARQRAAREGEKRHG